MPYGMPNLLDAMIDHRRYLIERVGMSDCSDKEAQRIGSELLDLDLKINRLRMRRAKALEAERTEGSPSRKEKRLKRKLKALRDEKDVRIKEGSLTAGVIHTSAPSPPSRSNPPGVVQPPAWSAVIGKKVRMWGFRKARTIKPGWS